MGNKEQGGEAVEEKIGQRLMKIRVDNGMKQKDFAEALGMSCSSVSRMEKGDFIPSKRTKMLICNKFGVNKEWLETGKGEIYTKEKRASLSNLKSVSGIEGTNKKYGVSDDTISEITRAIAGQNDAKRRLILFVANMPDSLIYAFCEYLEAQREKEEE